MQRSKYLNGQFNHQGNEVNTKLHLTIFRYVYAPYHHEKGNMNEVEWEMYLNLVDFFLAEPEYQLDGIIYESVLNCIFLNQF